MATDDGEAGAEDAGVTRAEFWAALSEADRKFLRELADRKTGMGPLTFLAAWRTKREDG